MTTITRDTIQIKIRDHVFTIDATKAGRWIVDSESLVTPAFFGRITDAFTHAVRCAATSVAEESDRLHRLADDIHIEADKTHARADAENEIAEMFLTAISPASLA